MTANYQLKLRSGRVADWDGASAEDAARRYVDCHRESVVVATRRYQPAGVWPWCGAQIVEPGHPAWGRGVAE